jgi:hypothetical protein
MPEGDVEQRWESHDHEAVVHSHEHYHLTHNHNPMTGGFDHLSSAHSHEHDHAPVKHAHWPHENFESEHQGEAHVHDHGTPVKKRAPAKKAAAKKA